MAELLGFLIGGIIWTYLFGRLAARIAFKDYPPNTKALYGSTIAFGFICFVASFGFDNSLAGIFYAPGAIFGFILLRKDYHKAWIGDEHTFD